jgi:hypothetical protein
MALLTSWMATQPAAASQRVFVSSTSSLGDLGGIAGADATCQQLAAAEGLGGVWGAWLSDATTDAIDRLYGEGPFVLVGTGAVVAATRAELTSGTLQSPIDRSEAGVFTSGAVWTGTDSDGTRADSGNFCDGWSDATSASFGQTGSTSGTNSFWTNGNQVFCDVSSVPVRIFCFEQDFESASPQQVFVSSTSSLGDLGGLAGADASCQQLAASAGLGGSWVAWLSDAATDAIDRLHGDGPFVTVGTGAVVAIDRADLTSGILRSRIDRTETGALGNSSVWTGTDIDGTRADSGNFCDAWTNATSSFFGQTGSSQRTNASWTEANQVFCDSDTIPKGLFCFQQAPQTVPSMSAIALGVTVGLLMLSGVGLRACRSMLRERR